MTGRARHGVGVLRVTGQSFPVFVAAAGRPSPAAPKEAPEAGSHALPHSLAQALEAGAR